MTYKVYPISFWATVILSFIATQAFFLLLDYWEWWVLPIGWLVSTIAGVLTGQFVLSKQPKAIYINSAEIDGQGYTHTNTTWIIAWAVFMLVVSVGSFLLSLTRS